MSSAGCAIATVASASCNLADTFFAQVRTSELDVRARQLFIVGRVRRSVIKPLKKGYFHRKTRARIPSHSNLSHSGEGKVLIENTASQKQELVEEIEKFLAAGRISQPEHRGLKAE